jgi:methionyl aminopeptidase
VYLGFKLIRNLISLGAKYDPFPNFKYTGPLRPVYPLTPTRSVPEHIPRPDHAEDGMYMVSLNTMQSINPNSTFTGTPVAELAERGETNIKVLNAEEIEAMRKVCKVI